MTDLQRCFVEEGFDDVSTYIQSGNVLFSTTERSRAALVDRIERALCARFGFQATVVVRSHRELQHVVEHAPEGFGAHPTKHRYDVLFLKQPLTASAALKLVPAKPGVDDLRAGKGALYYSRLISKASQSRLAKVVALPIYKSMTIRNWNTTTKLLRLMDAHAER